MKTKLSMFSIIIRWILSIGWFGLGIYSYFYGAQYGADTLRWMLGVTCILLSMYNMTSFADKT